MALHRFLPALLLALPCAAAAAPADIPLATNGRSDYQIVVPRDAIPSEKHAAGELQSFVKQITGAELPIRDDTGALPERAILLGRNAFLDKVKAGVAFEKLGKEGFALRTVGPHLVIAGGRPRGTLYGVYTLLEEHLGCRWFTSKVSRIPKQPTLALGAINDTQVPRLEYREPFWFDAFDADWAARNKANSASARLDETRGGKIVYEGFVHTFNSLVPPEKYYDEHPEYFSQVSGKRMKGYYQLCLTNPDVLRISVETVKEWLRKNPAANIVSVSQNDTGGRCECANCKKIEEEEGSPAGPIIRFVNAVAAAIEPEFPQVAIDTLAYQYSRPPVTKTRPRPNVIVRLCSIECCFSHTLEEEDTKFKDDIVGWSRMSDRLYVWDYVATFGHYVLPFTNIEVLQPNVKFFVEHGVKGIFEEGAYQSNGAEMAELKAYLLAKILWNPDCDVEKHRREFMEGVYGNAAVPIDRYLRMLRAYALEKKVHQPIWIGPQSGHLTPETLAKANALFDQAEAAVAGDPDTLHRVQVARLPIQYVQLAVRKPDTANPWTIRGDFYGPMTDAAAMKTADQFFAVCAKENVTHLSEGAFHPDKFREQVAPSIYGAKLVTLENAAVRLRVAPLLAGRILTVEDKARGLSPVVPAAPTAPGFPNDGGYWESAGFTSGAPGSAQPFTIEGQPAADQVTLALDLGKGLTLKRIIRLTDSGWRVESTITNTAGEARPARLRTTLEMALGGENLTLKAGGKETALTIPADANRTRVALIGGSLPKDGWTLAGPAGVAVQCRVEGDIYRYLILNRAEGPLALVQALTPEKTLQPKETLAVTATYTLMPAPKTEAVKRERVVQQVEAEQDDFSLFREGELSGVKEDPTAADGFTAWMGGQHHEWAIQWPIERTRLEPDATYEVSAVVRFDVKGKVGGACTAGIYDVDKKAGVCYAALAAEAAKAEWQTLVIGRLKPAGNQYVWIAPTINAENIATVYVDHLVFKRVEDAK